MSPEEILGQLALVHPDVELGVACAGTKVESRTYRVCERAFLFVRPLELMLKLAELFPEAQEWARRSPEQYKTGAGGWVTVKLAPGLPPKEVLVRWIGESYRLMAVVPAKRAKKRKG